MALLRVFVSNWLYSWFRVGKTDLCETAVCK